MTLNEIIDIIKKIGLSQPNVNSSSEGSIYEILNANPSIDYANFHITQNKHTSNNQFITYNFIFFYTDRLMEGNTNKVAIQSIGIEVLSNVMRTLQAYYEDIDISNTDFQPFTERFSDNCAGVFSNVAIEIPIEYTCEETFGNIINIGGSNEECECEIKNEYIEVDVNENGKLVVNYNPAVYTGIERVVINTNVPQTIITGDTINNQSKSVTYTSNGTYRVSYDVNYTGLDKVNIEVNVPQTIISGDSQTFETEDITITKNGTYYPTKDGFNKVLVNVPEKKFIGEQRAFTISKNGTYEYYPNEGVDGITKMIVNVDVPQEVISGGTTTLTGSVVLNDGFQALYGCTALKNIGDVIIENGVTGCVQTFRECENLETIGNIIIPFGISSCNSMFNRCHKLTTLTLDESWNNNIITDVQFMFAWCDSLQSLDLRNFNMQYVQKTNGMFAIFNGTLTDLQLYNLPNVDLSEWDLYTCDKLSIDSLINVLNALPVTTENYSVSLGPTNLEKLNPEQIAIATNKGWTII